MNYRATIRGKRPCSRLQPKPGTNCSSGALVGSRFRSCRVILSLSVFLHEKHIHAKGTIGQNLIPERRNSMSTSKKADPRENSYTANIFKPFHWPGNLFCQLLLLQQSPAPSGQNTILSTQDSKSHLKCLPQHTASLLGSDTHQHLPQNNKATWPLNTAVFVHQSKKMT